MISIGIIGLGKLGTALYDVIVEKTNNFVLYNDLLERGPEYRCASLGVISQTTSLIFICVNTPEDDQYDGSSFYNIHDIEVFDYDYTSITDILNELRGTSATVVINSTVSPQSINAIMNNFNDMDLIYNPFMFEGGNEYNSILNQNNVIIGLKNREQDYSSISKLYGEFGGNENYHVLNYTEASLLKMSHNLYTSLRVSFVNSLQRLSQKLGCDTQNVLDNLKEFPIFNKPKFLNVGLPSGGPCIPRDSLVLAKLNDDPFFGEILNDRMTHIKWLSQKIKNLMLEKNMGGISLHGIGYKKGLDNVKGSSGVLLKKSLEDDNIKCIIDEERQNYLNVLINSNKTPNSDYYDVWLDKFILK
jgi:nucleotide sugar dehydrogenase